MPVSTPLASDSLIHFIKTRGEERMTRMKEIADGDVKATKYAEALEVAEREAVNGLPAKMSVIQFAHKLLRYDCDPAAVWAMFGSKEVVEDDDSE